MDPTERSHPGDNDDNATDSLASSLDAMAFRLTFATPAELGEAVATLITTHEKSSAALHSSHKTALRAMTSAANAVLNATREGGA